MSLFKEPPDYFDLTDCFDLHLEEEILDEWTCEGCKGKQSATKKLDIWQPPETLIVHLKRFVEHPKYQEWMKLSTLIKFPVDELDLREYVTRPGFGDCCKYELVAISNHIGGTDRGHYTSYCKRGDGWFYFDDDVVTPVQTSEVSNSAYVLFYHRIR
jgi:ubiquitin carboxyl-terminal hydrolase 4/11/15